DCCRQKCLTALRSVGLSRPIARRGGAPRLIGLGPGGRRYSLNDRTEMNDRFRARRTRLNFNHVRSIGVALATTDGRWALVSASLSLLVAGSVTWMAIGTLPVSNPLIGKPSRTPVAYELFMKL